MGAEAFLAGILRNLADAFAPLRRALERPAGLAALLGELGWGLDARTDTAAVATLFGPALHALSALEQAVSSLEGAPASSIVSATGQVSDALSALLQSFRSGPASSGSEPPLFPFGEADFLAGFADDLIGYLTYRWLQSDHQTAFGVLRLLGVLSETNQAPAGKRFAYRRRNVNWSFIPRVVAQPSLVLDDIATYNWGDEFNYVRLLDNLLAAANAFGLPALPDSVDEQTLNGYWDPAATARDDVARLIVPLYSAVVTDGTSQGPLSIELDVLPIPTPSDRTGAPVGVALSPTVGGKLASGPLSLTETASLRVAGAFALNPVTLEVRPGSLNVVLISGSNPSIESSIQVDITPITPLVFGAAGSSRIEIGAFHIALALRGTVVAPELIVELGIDKSQVVVDFSESDSFLKSCIPGGPQTVDLHGALTWSSKSGVRVNGQIGIEATIPINAKVAGVMAVDTLSVGARAGAESGTVAFTVALTGSLQIGPVALLVHEVGIRLNVAERGAHDGNVGPLHLDFGLKAPEGLGLSLHVAAAGVSGSGFLSHDPDKSQYLGAVSLAVANLSIVAVGVLDTRGPPGPDYSLVILAAVTFPPVQLGFGFALVGIGGLIGLNRTVDVPALQHAARGGALDDVMFPADLAHNAARVAADLGRYFPPKDGQYVVGLAVRVVWGSAGLLTADIAVVVEFPAPLRIALLGSLHLTLPKPSAPVVDITLDVLGVFDPAAKTLSIDAGLRDSKIAGFTLTGQAAIRARWDANASFVVAVGGFHPHFKAPAAFPPLRRVTLALGGANPRLTLSTYMALTSNTVQFGATAELYVTAGPAAVRGHLSFDAVVQPFTVRIDLSIKVEVLLGGYPLLALGLDLHLSGPSPWHIGGRAHFHVLFLSFTVPINLTIGSAAPLLPPVPVDVVAVVVAALTERHNWHYGPPPGPPVATIGPGVTPDACVHPLGTIAVRQSVVPLGTQIDRLGADILRRPTTVDIDRSKLTVNGRPVAAIAVTDYFAPAQFMTLGDAAKLSAPSFETMAAGALFGPAGFSVPQHDTAAVVTPSPKQWTTLIVEPSDTAPAAGATRPAGPLAAGPSDQLLAAQLPGAAATVNGAASQGPAPYRARPCGKSVAAPTYAAVNMALAPQDPTTTRAETFATLSSAAPAHQPVQVIFTSEIPGAAPPLSAWRI